MPRRNVRFRGGFVPPAVRKSPFYKPFAKTASKFASGELKKRMPSAAGVAEKFLNSPLDKAIFNILTNSAGMTGFTIPGLGVLTAPNARSRYSKVTNRGTGLTRSNYMSGKPSSAPKTVYNTGYKCNRLLSDTGSNFTVTNSNGNQRGVVDFPFLTAEYLLGFRSQFPSNDSSTSDLSKIYLANTKSTVSITSATNINVSLRIYEMVSRIDTNVSTYRTPASAWSNGIDARTGSADTSTYLLIGCYPSMSDYLREYWHVDAYYDVELPAGQSHIHTSTYHHNQILSACRFANHGNTSTIAGITRAYLFVLSTTPIHDSTNESNVSLGIGKVDINIVQNFEFWSVPQSDSQLSFSITGDAVTTAEVVTQSDYVESGIVN